MRYALNHMLQKQPETLFKISVRSRRHGSHYYVKSLIYLHILFLLSMYTIIYMYFTITVNNPLTHTKFTKFENICYECIMSFKYSTELTSTAFFTTLLLYFIQNTVPLSWSILSRSYGLHLKYAQHRTNQFELTDM